MRFILGAKPGDHAFLFDWVDNTPGTRAAEFAGEDGVRHRFRWLNGAPLNDANFDLEVNFLEYREITPEGKVRHFSWVTDLPVGEDNLMELMRAGRARWRLAGRQGRERDLQHPEEPRLRLRAQLRPRRQAPRDGAGAPDDAGLQRAACGAHRPDPAALLRGVPPRAGEGETPQVPVGAGARRVPAGGGAGLGDAVRGSPRRTGSPPWRSSTPRSWPAAAGSARRGFFRDDESRRRAHRDRPGGQRLPVGGSRRLPRAKPAAEHGSSELGIL